MKRYVRQQDDWSCSPRAVLNALKWRGDKATIKSHLTLLTEDCKTEKNVGTYQSNVIKTLKKYNFKVCVTRDYQRVKRELQNGKSVILNHLDLADDWHHSFWYKYENGKFYGANVEQDLPEKTEFSHQWFKSYLAGEASALILTP